MKIFSRLSRILSLNFILAAALPILIIGLITTYIITRNMTEEITSKNMSISKSISGEVERFLNEPVSLLGQISEVIGNNFLKDKKEIHRYLNTARDNYRFLDMIQILDRDGIIEHVSPFKSDLIGMDMSYEPFYEATLDIQRACPVELPYWSPTFISMQTDEPTLSISKVMKNGMVVGYLNLDILNTITNRLKTEKGYVIIVDREGTVISHIEKQNVLERVNLKHLESVSLGLAGNEGTVREMIQDKEALSSVTIVPQPGWVVMFLQDVDEAFATVNKVKSIFVVGILLTLIIAVIIAIMSIQKTLIPLSQLIARIKKVSSGDYAAPQIEKSYDEIDDLAENFDTMIWEVKTREDALLKSEEKYRMLVEKMTDGLTILDETGLHVFVNDRFCDMLGYQPSEIIGRPSTDFLDTFNQAIIKEQLEERRKGKLDPYELTYIRKDGSELHTLVSPSTIFDNDGTFTGSFGVITEITDLKKTENELRKSRARFRSLVETIPHGIQENDINGIITFSNAAHHKMLGYDKGEIPGMAIWDLLASEAEKESLRSYLRVLVETRPSPTPYVTQSRKKDGSTIETTVDWDYTYDESGDLTGFTSIITDITEQKHAQDALKESEEKFRSITESSPMGMHMYELREDGRLVFIGANPAADSILGMDNNQFIGKTIEEAFPHLIGTEVPEKYRTVAERGETWHTEQIEYEDDRISGVFDVHAFQTSPNKMVALFLDVSERKKAEEALNKEREFTDKAIDTQMDTFFVFDPETGKAIRWNKRFRELSGYTDDEIAEMKAPDSYYNPQDLENAAAVMEEIIRTGHGKVEMSLICKDGTRVPTEYYASTITDEEENHRYIISIGRDITKRKQAEEALQESEERFRALFDNSTEGILISDIETKRLFTGNRAICEMIGYSCDELEDMRVMEIHPEDELAYIMEQYERQTKKEIVIARDIPVKKKDGTVFYADINSFPITLGKQRLLASSFRDITERKQAEEALKESEERFRELAELLPESIFEINTDNIVTYANKNAFDQFGYTDKEFEKGINGISMLITEDRERAMENTRRILNGEDIGINEYTAERKDGTRFPAMFRSAAVFRHGKPIGLRGFIIDMTEQKRIESQLRQTQKMEAIGTLAGGIAHDFNNILTAIIGYTEVLKRKLPEDGSAISALDNILDAGDRASDLVKQILTFSRRDEVEYAPILIGPIAKEVLKLIRSTIPTTIELRQSIGSAGPVIADPTQIHQIIMNLCTNAYHAMQDSGGTMHVDLEETDIDTAMSARYPDLAPGTYARLDITDSGHGIDPSIMDKIFDPYFTTKEKGKGTGLGLSVVHGIVKSFGGSIKVESELSKGTSVQVFFPVIREDKAEEDRPETELPHGDETVLFVDDEESLCILCKELLEVLGYSVTTKARGIDALGLFREDPDRFDLVITDMTMPGMTGLKLSEELLEVRKDISIILCTGYSEGLSEEYVKQKGIKAFLMKPFSSGNLSKTVRKVLDGNRR